jgi:hypothetical protein
LQAFERCPTTQGIESVEPFHSDPSSGEKDNALQVIDGNSDNRMSSSPTQRRLALGAAGVTSAVGLAMAAAAAMERGGTLLDQTLIVAIACVLVLGAHLLPSLSRSPLARLLWLGCLLLTAWGHATFFTAASHRAGSVRAEAVVTTSRAEALRAELQAIQARPLAMVSAELAATQARASAAATAVERCQRTAPSEPSCQRLSATAETSRLRAVALTDEMNEARRAAVLRNRLAEAAGEQDAARQVAAVDPIAQSIARLMGLPAELLSTGVSVLSAIVIELMAALLWSIGLQQEPFRTADQKPVNGAGVGSSAKPRRFPASVLEGIGLRYSAWRAWTRRMQRALSTADPTASNLSVDPAGASLSYGGLPAVSRRSQNRNLTP